MTSEIAVLYPCVHDTMAFGSFPVLILHDPCEVLKVHNVNYTEILFFFKSGMYHNLIC